MLLKCRFFLVLATLLAAGSMSAALLAGCGDSGTTISPLVPFTVAAADTDNGRSFSVANGGTITITLASNASTGYHWTITNLDTQHFSQVGTDTYIGPPAGSPPGTGGQQVFTFKALASGTSSLALEYDPPGGGAPAQTYRIAVMIV